MDKNEFSSELEIQKNIAYTAGLLQGDVTIKTLIESLAEGIVIINELGRIILINKRMSELSGYEKQEVMGQDLNIFISQFSHKRHATHIKDYFGKPRIRPMGIGLELTAKRKDQSTFPVEISLSYLDTDSGRLGIGFLTNISSRKEAENELKRRNIELDSYAHTVAHDLNSSLIGMVSYSELLLDTSTNLTKEKQDIYLNQIAQSGRNMTKVIRELLIFASLKKEDVDIRSVNMENILQSTIQRLKYQLDESSTQIIKNEKLLNCFGYSPWIEEVWLNFISNAIKYGGTPPLIEISSYSMGNGYIKYSIKDNGKGLSEDLKKYIFEQSVINKDQEIKGYGLGLSIVKRITEKLDGYLTVDSEIGKGSEFSFYLKEETTLPNIL